MRVAGCFYKINRLAGLLLFVAAMLSSAGQAFAAYNINISGNPSAGGSWSGTSPDVWTASGAGANVSVAEIRARLNGGTGVTISTAGAGSDAGNININAATAWSAGTLTLTAHNDININAVMSASNTAGLAMNYGWNGNTGTPTYGNQGGLKVGFAPGEANGFAGKVDFPGSGILAINGDIYTVIKSVIELQLIFGTLTGKFILGTDINASETSTWNGGAGFLPIGDNSTTSDVSRFTGVFDGLGHTINGLFINRPSTDNVGLFGYCNNAILRNVGIVGGNVSGQYNVGSLIGSGISCVVSNSYNSAVVSGNSYIGGLAGSIVGSISNSYNSGAVSGSFLEVGGLVGESNAKIINSYSTGTVDGSSIVVGGLVGNNNAAVINSYAIGSVNGALGYFGGLVGYNDSGGSITSSYAAGAVSVESNTGGLVGSAYDTSVINITNSFWNKTINSALLDIGLGLPKTTSELKQLTTFASAGWDIDTLDGTGKIWRITEGQTYPLLRTFIPPQSVAASTAATAITTSGATLNGTVNALYADATVSFQYGLTTAYGTSAAATPATVIVGSGNTAVSAAISGLTPGQTYHCRVVATNSAGTVYGNDVVFTVLQLTQTISGFSLPSTATYGNGPITLAASASSGLPVSFSVISGPGTISGNQLTITGVGTISLQASQSGNLSYIAASNVTASIVVGKATAAIALSNLNQTYNGSAKPVTVTTTPAGLGINVTYDGSATAPTAVGTYPVVATISDSNYQGTISGSLVITKATAPITLGNLSQTYNGSPKAVTVTTTPAALFTVITYNGSPTVPTEIGSYAVTATISDINYQGTVSGTLVINTPTLTVAVTANGAQPSGTGGTITSSPAGISCANSAGGTLVTCAGSFAGTVNLYATPYALSTFGGWGGGNCSGLGACSVTMTGDKTVTATFNQATLLHIGGTPYATLQAAYNAVTAGAVIQLLDNSVAGTLNANKNVAVSLKGGYDTGYANNTGTTTLTAPLTIGLGSVVIDRIVIK